MGGKIVNKEKETKNAALVDLNVVVYHTAKEK